VEGEENLKTEIFIMKYDVFILFARADAEFARHVAKGLERINLSVLYNTSLPRPVNINQRPLQNAVVEGFNNALYGIVIVSKHFMEADFVSDDLDYLCDILLMENQILHPIWYHISDSEVSNWYPRMAMNLALRYPPETVDSVARKFQVKFAGSSDLQHRVLTGFHSQIQYISPKISTYRPPALQMPDNKLLVANENIDSPAPPSLDGMKSASSKNSDDEEALKRSIDDELILYSFDLKLRHEICKRLDVYLKGLSNWKDLAAAFLISDEQQIRNLLDTKEPTMNLLDVLSSQDITLGQFKNALRKIERYDVIECINNNVF